MPTAADRPKFRTGDIVRLEPNGWPPSGPMVITNPRRRIVSCVWWDCGKACFRENEFAEEDLVGPLGHFEWPEPKKGESVRGEAFLQALRELAGCPNSGQEKVTWWQARKHVRERRDPWAAAAKARTRRR